MHILPATTTLKRKSIVLPVGTVQASESAMSQSFNDSIRRAVAEILLELGENPKREGLRETPARVAKALKELTAGYLQDEKKLFKTFNSEYSDQIVLLKNIPFTSLCEHHMLSFSGTASIGYLPNKRIIGVSKLARLLDMYARRLQVQERLTWQVADSLMRNLKPRGVGVIVEASHSCMYMRGVKKSASMKTSVMLGVFRKNGIARQEFLELVK